MKKETLIKLKNLAKNYDLDLFILFGSRANNSHNKDSDWDFAYLKYKNFTFEKEIRLISEISQTINSDKIDLINLREIDEPLIRYKIAKDGKLIYGKKEDFLNFQLNSIVTYFDYEDFFKEEKEFVQKKIENM